MNLGCPTPDLNPNDLYCWTQFIKWLTPDGVLFFRSIMNDDGTIPLVTKLDGIPHPVHFREGMQVRNWMRKYGDFTADYIENHWRDFVVGCLNIEKENTDA